MQHRRLWYRSGLGLALAIGMIGYPEPQTIIRAVPQSQASIEKKLSSTASVFSDTTPVSESAASSQTSSAATDSSVDEKVNNHSDSEASSDSRSSTKLEKDKKSETAMTKATRAAEMVNGTVAMTLDTNGTLHLSGGSFGTDVGNWITQTLTANGYNPTQVSKVVIEGRITTYNISNYNYLFAGLANLTTIEGLANVDLSNVTSLEYLFNEDRQLRQVDFGQRNLSRVQSFKGMFYQCSSLTTITGISQWQTTSVTDLSQMFTGCSQLVTLDLNGWDVSQVVRLVATFKDCAKLTTLNVADWSTGSLITLEDTFNGDSSLTTLPVGKWNVGKVGTLIRTFNYCSSLTSLDVANWDTRQVMVMSATFRGMSKIKSLPIDKWQTGRVHNMQLTFYEDASLENINIANWDTSQVNSLDYTFAKLSSITTLPIDNWKTSNMQSLRGTFYNSPKLTTLPIGNWDVGQVFDMNSTFTDCSGLTTLPIAGWNTKNVQNLGATFAGMISITTLPVDNWQTGKVTNMSETFRQVNKVTNLPISKWDTSHVTTMSQLFADNPQLTSLPITNWNTSSLLDVSQLFSGDSGLKTLSLSAWNTAKVTKFDAAFENTNLDKLDLSGWNTNQAQSYANTFSGKLPPKHLLLGKGFNFFNSTSWNLSDPSRESPYIGRWRSLNNNKVYTSTELMTKYDGKSIVGEFEWATGSTITVKYVDANGKSLAPDTKISGAADEAYHVKPIEIEGYLPDQPDGVKGTFTDKDETIILTYKAENVMFTSVPEKINFGNNQITGQSESYDATYDTGLSVQDNRILGSTWSLTAKLEGAFTGEKTDRPLAATLSYKNQQTGSESVLIPGFDNQIIENHQTTSHENVNVIGEKAALGTLYLKVPTDRALTDTYRATITWSINQMVPNQ
ncbi:cell surface protein [Lactobacillus plantarum] [Lactiplantibacillus mudanjiangensis]|uniref:BspA family leucine-rich repeat surface protein n=1 Tax=Lactiplantibacillus mudanjiangensis TaxID=1296538 RepID=UPI001014A476|nr:BspA family leucine-rich repeat surface protein [Lactiplantibacillus mudanjiangensis]VDG33717.1 cell surface protein [Lactobacillus plantarum] [Lactiplantibacillus mudanjiangensis]